MGDDGKHTERAELDSGKHAFVGRDVWYGFSFLIPPSFPVVDNRLVIAQWKQTARAAAPGRGAIPQRQARALYSIGKFRLGTAEISLPCRISNSVGGTTWSITSGSVAATTAWLRYG